MKVARKYIPLAVRVQVAERQLRGIVIHRRGASLRSYLAHMLFIHFGENKKIELHHRPALVNRPWNKRKKDYDPPANDPAHLVYLAADDHDIETRVRGVGAQRSDLGQRRYNKKVARNRKKITGRASDSHAKLRRPKRKWPSRPLKSASRWPTRKSFA